MIAMAKSFAEKRGIDLAQYDVRSEVWPIVLLGGLRWSVSFSGKGVGPERLVAVGDHFTVYIDDQTGSMEFLEECSMKITEPNQPLQRNASTGSVLNFESPARRG
jgi:hypothetical protein